MNHFLTILSAFLLALSVVLPGHAAQADEGAITLPDSSDEGIVNLFDDEADGEEDAESASQDDEPSLSVDINGSLRYNVLFRAYNTPLEEAHDRILGDGGFTFDTFRIGASGSYGGLIFDAEYAFYPESFGGMFIHHGWAGYKFSETQQIQVGVSQVPFGIQPYASSSWFFNATYYVGLEDDYDAGIKAIFTPGNWELKAAYYMNPEQTDFFAGQDFSRYSYDVIPVSAANYQVVPGSNQLRSDLSEEHQFNGKVTYTFNHGDLGFSKVGVSGQRGQLLNQETGATDAFSAYAVHLQGRYGGFGAKLEYAQQTFDPPLSDAEKATFDAATDVEYGAEDFVVMGAYAFPQRVASEHSVYSSSLSYRIPVDAGPISQIKPYYDFSMVTKTVDDWNNNVTHDVGFLTTAGPMYIYTDLNVSKGHPFNHPAENFASVMAGNNDNTWRTAFNVNIGIYF